jgi:phosphotransferase system  glucose/maltose/N-acetylglucosamine-specific IIC component
MNLFRWTLGTAFVVSFVTFILEMLGARAWLMLIIALALTVYAVVHGMRKFGVPDSAFTSGGIIGLAAVAGMLIGSSAQEILEYIVILVLFAAAYFIAGFIAGRTFGHREKKKRRGEDEEESAPSGEQV